MAYARKFLGVPYKLGASGPSRFDCSGYTTYVYKHFGYKITPFTGAQFKEGRPVHGYSDLQKGDLVFFGKRGSVRDIGHVGIVVSVDYNRGSFRFIHASTSGGVARQLANAHTIFNVVNTAIQLPFAGLIAALIQRLIPAQTETLYAGARFLDEKLLDTAPAAAVHAVRSELLEMAGLTEKMIDLVRSAFFENTPDAAEKQNQIEDGVNDLTGRIAEYSARLWRRHLSSSLSRRLEYLVNGSSDLERIGDHAKNLMELYDYMTEHELSFSPQAMDEFDGMLTLVRSMVEKAAQALRDEDLALAREVAGPLEERTDAMEKQLRHLHIQRLNEGLCAPASGVVFIDLVTNLERIGDHATNVAEIVLAMRGEKTGVEKPGSY